MKTRVKELLLMLSLAFFSTTIYATNQNSEKSLMVVEFLNQEEKVVTGVYKGHDESGYQFSVIDEKGTESLMTFLNIDQEATKSNDLKADKAVGTPYKITYTVAEDGVKTIKSLLTVH